MPPQATTPEDSTTVSMSAPVDISPSASNKRSRHSERSSPSGSASAQPPAKKIGTAHVALDEHRLRQRQKQIDYGKNTLGYDEYIRQVPKSDRKSGDPVTPDKHANVSKRAFDGLIRAWRRKLHKYDPPGTQAGEDMFDISFDGDDDLGAVDADVVGPADKSTSSAPDTADIYADDD